MNKFQFKNIRTQRIISKQLIGNRTCGDAFSIVLLLPLQTVFSILEFYFTVGFKFIFQMKIRLLLFDEYFCMI